CPARAVPAARHTSAPAAAAQDGSGGGDGAAGFRPPLPGKPAWVVAEVIRLKALMPRASVRAIATTFNALWQARRGETVGKTWVTKIISAHQLEILRKRAEIKQRRPWPMARNRVWALDLSYLPDSNRKPTPIFGLIDHGTRACL